MIPLQSLIGGNGTNTLRILGTSNLTIDSTDLSAIKHEFNRLDIIDLQTDAAHHEGLTFDVAGAVKAIANSNHLVIDGTAMDSVTLDKTAYAAMGTEVFNSETYNKYVSTAHETLLVDQAINQHLV